MMINKRLIGTVSESKKYIALNVAAQWLSLGVNIGLMATVTGFLGALYRGTDSQGLWITTILVGAAALILRHLLSLMASRMSYLAGKTVKLRLREQIYEKLLSLGSGYRDQVKTSEVVQVAVEGVDQLETYFGAYLPQFFYAMLAPLTLFGVLSFVNFPAAVVLLICVPLIPVSIALVQTWAKKLLSKYWDQYTGLGDTFLENLQGLTTLKIFGTDGVQHEKMNREAENFRKITMRVLTMQLNSITIMDLVAYGGAALGVILAVTQLQKGAVSLEGCLLIILLAADFFLPMRLLGSFFHIAMNGMAASDKIFRLLDLEAPDLGGEEMPGEKTIRAEDLSFQYEKDRPVLRDVSLDIRPGSFTALVGESGCGKSTLAGLIMGRNRGYTGTLSMGGTDLSRIREDSLLETVTYVSHRSYLFKGTVRENLLMGRPEATDRDLQAVLERVKLWGFLQSEQGLDTKLQEQGSNLSGGQCQRLALARAILHDSPVYIFDEATSNIDVESETAILEEIRTLAETKTVILISHRLANVVDADQIYVLDKGCLTESGTHDSLIRLGGTYAALYGAQQELEAYGREVRA